MSRLTDVELLRRLVAIDTTSSRSNEGIADFICDYVSPARAERITSSPGKVNLLISRDSPQQDDLLLCGHLDTVPATEPEWSHDPFALLESGGLLYGRGTADMKGFVAIALNLFLQLASTSRIHLLLTCDEEIGCLGARSFAERCRDRTLPRRAIIGEPTSLQVVNAHKGHLKLRIVVRGRAAHSAYPHLGENAIEKAATLIAELALLRQELAAERAESSTSFPDAPFMPLNIATIRGGTAINIVPDRAEIEIGLRLLPGMQASAVLDRIATRLRRLAVAAVEVVEISNSPPMLLEQDHPFLDSMLASTGQSSPSSVNFATDAGWLQTLGIDCVLFGPGSIEVAHRPDEFVPADQMTAAAKTLERFIRNEAPDV